MRGITGEELLERYIGGERDFSGIDLSGIWLDHEILSEIDLRTANLFQGYFQEAELENAKLSRTNLKQSILCGAYLTNTDLRGADLTCADLEGADLIYADLRGANLTGANLKETITITINTNFKGANLRDVNWEDMLLCDTIMPDGSIESDSIRVITAEELLNRYAMGERRFPSIILHRADLRNCDLRDIRLNHFLASEEPKYRAFLVNVNLSGAILENSILSYVNFNRSNLSEVNFAGADLCSVTFRYANLRGVKFGYAFMEWANFTGADLTGASDGVYWLTDYRNTIMPDGEFLAEHYFFGD